MKQKQNEPDLWKIFGHVQAYDWRCRSNETNIRGECLGCPAVQGEDCRRVDVEIAGGIKG